MELSNLPRKLTGEQFAAALRLLHEEEVNLRQQVENPRTRRLAVPRYGQFTRIVHEFEETGLAAYAVQAMKFIGGGGQKYPRAVVRS